MAITATSVTHDLREFLDRVEAIGELDRVKKEVDWDMEMAAIAYLQGKDASNPAVLFENIKGYGTEFGSLWNWLNSFDRVAIAFGEEPGQAPIDLVQAVKNKLKRQLPPVEVDAASAPISQNILKGDDVDLLRLPTPRHWPLDGGRYLGTADAVATRNPDNGVVNLGTYRMMVHDRNHIGLYLSPGKDARLHIARAWQQGEPLEVAAVFGGDPLLFLVGSQAFPKNMSEYDFAGGIKGEPIQVIKGATVDLPIPALAEVVLEGIIRPSATRREGPFGEFTGYYGRPEAETPVVEVTALRFRNKPILANELMTDYGPIHPTIIRSARIWDDLDRLGIPGIKGVFAHRVSCGSAMHVVSLEQRYAGHAAQVLAIAAQSPAAAFFSKWIIAVDEDVDASDVEQVWWAMSTRCNPTEDIDILRQTWSTWLDPTQNPPDERPYGSKALINACKEHRYLPVFSKRTRLSREQYENATRRWDELGLRGKPAKLDSFEDTETFSYHESAELVRGNGASSRGPAAPNEPPSGMPSM